MYPNNSKVVNSVSANLITNRSTSSSDFNRNNLIFLRKSTDINHILLGTHPKNSVFVEDSNMNSKIDKILIQQSDIKKGFFVQSVKKVNSPILFLRGGDSSNEHIFIQASSAEDNGTTNRIEKLDNVNDNILLRALEGINDVKAERGKRVLTSLGSGKNNGYIFFLVITEM